MSSNEDLIWNIIGKKKFCCFKYSFLPNQNFCKNKFNLTGFCSKKSCPLANNKYATVIEKNGFLFLYLKVNQNINFPNRIWKKITLSRNFIKAIQQIDIHLALWPTFFVNKVKLRLTKLNQILIRTKIKNIEIKKDFISNLNLKITNRKKKFKLIEKIKIEKLIEEELLNRLHMGVYGENYKLRTIHHWKTKKKENQKRLEKTLSIQTIVI
nr:maintenance of killer 16, mak16-like protein [Cryptomonas curvata]